MSRERPAAPPELAARTQAWQSTFAGLVVAWQRSHGRHDLPWQKLRDPYRVWLSEIMLQQTQVTTVLGYYARFLERFPSVADLARTELDAVLAEWAGLGYYSRARNLHRCAQAVVADHGGAFPRSAHELAQLPGIGPSTAAAIAAFCFDERAAILDGNVKRVLSRALGFGADLAEKRHERALWESAQALLPQRGADMPAYTQGLMDLGATVCSLRKPACMACPLQAGCVAAREGQPEAYPVKTRKLQRKQRENWWLWLERDGCVWLEQRPATGVWAGLWSLPMFDSEAELRAAAATHAAPAALEPQPMIEHALTHFDWRLHPHRLALPSACNERPADARAGRGAGGGAWVPRGELARYGLPAPLKRLLAV
jgi:A/G-specific adenine glycosylase